MSRIGTIYRIAYKPQTGTVPASHFSRVVVQEADLIAGYGIAGDAKGGHPTRQMNIIAAEGLAVLEANGYRTEPGALGEQLVVSGIDVDALALGDQLLLGDCAVVEVTEYRRGCKRLTTVQGQRSGPAVGHMGVMVRVLVGGEIAIGSPVQDLNREGISDVRVCEG